MSKNYFISTHTLYFKVLIPLIINLIKRGEEVIIENGLKDLIPYSPDRFSKKPTQSNQINLSSLSYVAEIIDLKSEFDLVKHKIKFKLFIFPQENDLLFCTTKNINLVRKYKNKVKDIIVLGYQHMPVVLKFKGHVSKSLKNKRVDEVFINNNHFSGRHKFTKVILDKDINDYGYVNFLNLDRIYNISAEKLEKDSVLIFHPGGYRNLITPPGASKEKSYVAQLEFIKKFCFPVVESGQIAIIKTHPLFAKYHSKVDLISILDELIIEDERYKNVIVTDESFWKYAKSSYLVVSFGSSSLYELFSAKIPNLVVSSFYNDERSDKFTMFESIFIKDYEEYLHLVKNKKSKDLDDLTSKVYQAYSSLHDGKAVHHIVEGL